MDLRQLRHLVALADYRNFGRAAEAINLSQPAFSRSIQTLGATSTTYWWNAAAASSA